MKRFMAGFQILFKHNPDGDIAAEHDEVFSGGPPPDHLSAEELKILEGSGWSWDSDLDSWHKFV